MFPGNAKRYFLLIASIFFYFWGEPLFIWILFLQIFINYFLALLFTKTIKTEILSKFILVFSVSVNLLLLIFLRDSKFLISNLGIPIELPELVNDFYFPVGISFITFTSLSYLLDVSKGAIPAVKSILLYANYILFFPKIIQGPIQEFNKFNEDYQSPKISVSNIYDGLGRFTIGLAKKVIIADSLHNVAQSVFSADITKVDFSLSWYGLIAFGLQIYFDFSGYTDMALGVGRILGFSMPENFNHPYASTSIADFWRRWHMTLTGWFRKYIFYPLEFRLKNLGNFRQPLNLMIVFLLTGLWHGISPNYLVWGAYFGFLLALESVGLGKLLKRIPLVFQHLYSLFFILAGWVFFRLRSPSQWPIFFRALSGLNGLTAETTGRSLNLLGYIPILLIGVFLCLPIKNTEKFEERSFYAVFSIAGKIALLIISVAFIVERGYLAFFYQQF